MSCNSPTPTSPESVPLPESPLSKKETGMNDGDDDNSSQSSSPSPSRFPTPPVKEKHPPEESEERPPTEESADTNIPPAEAYCKKNPVETKVKEDPIPRGVTNEIPTTVEPIVISTSITTTNVKDLHELCQSHVRLAPSFEFKAQPPHGFSVLLRLLGPEGAKDIPAEGIYPSKKTAKEAVAGLGLEYVRTLPKSSKSMMQDGSGEDKTNWVGLLSDHCNARKTRPLYTDYATPGAGFSCEIQLPVELGFPGLEQVVFGDKHIAFKNKRSAKIAAAKAAMLWIREHSPTPPASSTTGPKKSGKPSKGTGNVIYPAGAKPASIINLVCPRLNVMTPEYVLTPDQRTPGMYDVTAIIRRPQGPRDVMIGPIKSVYGKKKAKEEMSNGVYNWIRKEAERQGVGIFEEGAES